MLLVLEYILLAVRDVYLAKTNEPQVTTVTCCRDNRSTVPASLMGLSDTGLWREQRFQFINRASEPGMLVYLKPGYYQALRLIAL